MRIGFKQGIDELAKVEYLPHGYIRCLTHDVTAKGMPLIRHSLKFHLGETLIRLVLQFALWFLTSYTLLCLLTHRTTWPFGS